MISFDNHKNCYNWWRKRNKFKNNSHKLPTMRNHKISRVLRLRTKNLRNKRIQKLSQRAKEWGSPNSNSENYKRNWQPKPRRRKSKRKLPKKQTIIKMTKSKRQKRKIQQLKSLPLLRKWNSLTIRKSRQFQTRNLQLRGRTTFWSHRHCPTWTMCLIWEISSGVCFQQMFTQDSLDCRATTLFISVELTNMEQPPRSRHSKRARLPRKSVTTIITFIRMFMSGLISVSTISEELALSGTPRFVRKFSLTCRRTTVSLKTKWPNVTVRSVKNSWPTDLLEEHALSASSLMQGVINVINVKNSSTHLLKWKILFAQSVSQPQLKKRLNTTLSTCQKSRRNWKLGWNSQAWRENGLKIQLEWLKPGLIWVSSPSASPETLNGVCQYQSKNSKTKFSMCGMMLPSGTHQSQQTC